MHQQSGWTATPSRLIGAPTSTISTIFTSDALPDTTLPIYPGLEQAPNMLAFIPSGLVTPSGLVDLPVLWLRNIIIYLRTYPVCVYVFNV